jgi:hypothetical protein
MPYPIESEAWNREEKAYAWVSASDRKVFGGKWSIAMLGLLLSFLANPLRGGSSTGEVVKRGDTEKVDPQSETSDGGPSTDSALETSETAGEGRGPSTTPRW